MNRIHLLTSFDVIKNQQIDFTIEIVGFVAGTLHPPVPLLDAGRFRFCTAVGDAAVDGVL